jgi:hypothetical protein
MSALKSDYNREKIPDAWLNEVAKLLQGMVTVDLSAGDVDISASDSYKCRALVLVGAIGANRVVTLPADAGRVWLVINNTSGAFTSTAKTSAGTGVAVTQGKSLLVECDGVNITAGHTDLAAIGAAARGANADITSTQALTQILDTNANEILKFAQVAAAVNELTATNAATGSGPLLEATGGDANIDVTVRGKGTGGVQVSRAGGKLAFFGAALAARAAALTQTYATADRTLSAYAANAQNVAYTGQDNAQAGTVYAKVADLNTLRTAYENLRAFAEDVAQLLNALVDDLQAYGLEQ